MMNEPPQWQQDVDRHSRLVDPVVTIQQLARFKPLRTTRIDHALVFTTAQGDFEVYLPPSRPSRADLATRRWIHMYEVDMGWHESEAVLGLASSNDAFLFEVSLSVSWQVGDPRAFVASGERNVLSLVQRRVEDAVRPVLRGYAMEDSGEAERQAQKVLEAVGPLGAEAGLNIRCGIQIRRDEEALEHARRLRELEFARQKLDPQHALLTREDELMAERALAQGVQQHRIELQTQNLNHERQLARGRQELELQEIEAKKIQFYAHHLERGGPTAMAFQLARHPEDARLVMENLREDQLRALQNQFQVAMQALGGGPGGLEEHQLDEPRRLAANVIREVLSARLSPGQPAAPLEVEASKPEPEPEAVASGEPAGQNGAEPDAPQDVPCDVAVLPEDGPLFGYPPPSRNEGR
ncbi:PE-PGRS family protein [Streptomyces sp. NPDC050529]|uniref:PE-PGRS family protein n=1 Tax=Streptomyces sp. NPDC050529 TaxID=3365624 RepID=UPI003795756F